MLWKQNTGSHNSLRTISHETPLASLVSSNIILPQQPCTYHFLLLLLPERIVDPTSCLLARDATLFFSSLFSNTLIDHSMLFRRHHPFLSSIACICAQGCRTVSLFLFCSLSLISCYFSLFCFETFS